MMTTKISYRAEGTSVILRDRHGERQRHGPTFSEARERGARDFARGIGISQNAFDLWSPRHRDEWERGWRAAQFGAEA